MGNKNSKSKKKSGTGFLKAGAIVIAVVMSLGAGALKLSETANEDMLEAVNPPYVIEESLDLPPETAEPVVVPQRKEREKQGIPVGSILAYIAGGILSALTWLLGKLGGPVLARVLGWILLAAAVVFAIVFALKKAFPDLSLKELIPKKTAVITVLAITAVIAIGELLIHFCGSQYSLPVQCGALVGGLLIVLFVFNFCSEAALKLPLRNA